MVSRKEGEKEDTFFPSCLRRGEVVSFATSLLPPLGMERGEERDGARPSLNGLESRPEKGRKMPPLSPSTLPLPSLATHTLC